MIISVVSDWIATLPEREITGGEYQRQMKRLWDLLARVGINAVPLWGLAFAEWSASTALLVYWFENLTGAIFVALRIALHRRLTGKRGHFRPQLGVSVTTGKATRHARREIRSFLNEFLAGSLLFTLMHGAILFLLLFAMVEAPLDHAAVIGGIVVVTVFQMIGFLVDLIGLKERPFAWIKQMAEYSLGRVVLIHLAIIGGVAVAAFSGRDETFLLPFALLKLLADVGSLFGRYEPGKRPPGWLVRLMNALRPGEDFVAYWASEHERALANAAADEEVGQG